MDKIELDETARDAATRLLCEADGFMAYERYRGRAPDGVPVKADDIRTVATAYLSAKSETVPDGLYGDFTPITVAASTALPAAKSEPVAVKALEWRDHRGHTFPDTWTAKTPCGIYEIEERSASDSPAYVVTGPLHVFIADKDSLDEAKAAAQADYESRIRSALASEPANG